MAMGRTHDLCNIGVGLGCSGWLLARDLDPISLVAFAGSWFFATWFFSPDADLGPKNRAGLLGIFLYPYRLFSKHRGLSHWPVVGTLSRLLYLLVLLGLVWWVAQQWGHVDVPTSNWSALWHFLKDFNPQISPYRELSWGIIGMIGADLTHLLVDKISDWV